VVAAEDGAMETDYEYAVARVAGDLPSPASVGLEAGGARWPGSAA
jgi:hypothetical protein